MKINLEQLSPQLKQKLDSIYVLIGNELLLIDEASRYIKKIAQKNDFNECHNKHVSAKFNWHELTEISQSLSLFSDKKIIDLDIANGKPGKIGSETLINYTNNTPSETILIVRLPKLTVTQQKSKWFSSLEKNGTVVTIWPIKREQFPNWLNRRLQRVKLTTSTQGLNLLANFTEGNLLAAKQTIERLSLLYGEGEIDMKQIKTCLNDNAHFDVYALLDAALQQDIIRCNKIFNKLKASGVEASLILWVLTKEIRILVKLAKTLNEKKPLDKLFQQYGIWRDRQTLLKKHLQHFSYQDYLRLIQLAAECDQILKGVQSGNIWHYLHYFTLNICQKNLEAA